MITQNPVKDTPLGLEPIKKHRKPKKLPVYVSAEDLLEILKVAKHKHHKFAYMMGWYSGLRISEILNVEPKDIDMVKGTVFVKNAPTDLNTISILL